MPNRKLLRSSFKRLFTDEINNFSKLSRNDGFIINMTLIKLKPIFLEDFLYNGNKKEDFEVFIKSVFKDEIKKIRC